MMQDRAKVGVSEAGALLFIFLTAKSFLTEAMFLFHAGFNATWMVSLLMVLWALGSVFLLVAVLNLYPGQDLVQIGENLVGPYINAALSLFYLLVFIFGAGLVLRGVSERMVAGFLPDTPISLVAFFFLLGGTVVAYLGVEAVARTSRFLIGVLVLSALFLIILTIPMWQYHALFPLGGSGLWSIATGSLMHSGDYVQIILLGVLVTFLPGQTAQKIGIRSVLLAGFALTLYVAAATLIFYYPAITEITLPSLEMAKIINVGRFGQRLEVMFLPVWVFGNLIYLSASVFAGGFVMTRLSSLKDYKPFVLATAVLTMVAAFMAPNSLTAASWYNNSISSYGLMVLAAILIFLLLVARVRLKDKGDAHHAQ